VLLLLLLVMMMMMMVVLVVVDDAACGHGWRRARGKEGSCDSGRVALRPLRRLYANVSPLLSHSH
jgi:Na+/glutamate symporter